MDAKKLNAALALIAERPAWRALFIAHLLQFEGGIAEAGLDAEHIAASALKALGVATARGAVRA